MCIRRRCVLMSVTAFCAVICFLSVVLTAAQADLAKLSVSDMHTTRGGSNPCFDCPGTPSFGCYNWGSCANKHDKNYSCSGKPNGTACYKCHTGNPGNYYIADIGQCSGGGVCCKELAASATVCGTAFEGECINGVCTNFEPDSYLCDIVASCCNAKDPWSGDCSCADPPIY